ncbi:MAG: FAD-binding oxidoreductase [Alphaproteobacteria bacterium]|nr:FAD-binding oxidoreductase [Alphaproteobacteria bacterium]
MASTPDLSGFLGAIEGVPALSDRITVRRKSRDMTAGFSPVMRQEMKDKFADVVVQPRSKDDVLRIAAAAARHRMPLIARGGGTANFGQGIPLRGGAIVDMTALDRLVWIKGPVLRAECGIRLAAIDQATRPHGFELRMFSSTKQQATLGGYIGGGHSGIGCCVHGILRDRGNIRAIEVVSVEAEPKIVELRGDDVLLVHHAYGTNGLITEIEMPLAPAWPWREAIVAFDHVMDGVQFAHDLAISDGIVKKLISILGAPVPQMIRELKPMAGETRSLVLCLIADLSLESFEALVRRGGGDIVSLCEEGQGPYGAPLYEFSWGHTRLQVNKQDPSIVGLIGLYASADPVADIAKSEHRFRHLRGLHFEVKRFDGRLSFQGSPYFSYTDDAQMAEIMRGMAEDGAMIANNHTFKVQQGGMKPVTAEDIAFKRRMDPHNLLNPGKMDFDTETTVESAGAELTDKTWSYREVQPGPPRDEAVAS